MDFFTDAQQISLAGLCDHTFHTKWLFTFEDASFPDLFIHCLDVLHMEGVLIMSISVSIVVQIGLLKLFPPSSRCAIIADYVGMSGLANIFLEKDSHQLLVILRSASTGLFENLPSLYLSTSLFSLTFDSVDDEAKSKQLVSLSLSVGSTMKLVFDTLRIMYDNSTRTDFARTLSYFIIGV